MRREGGRESEKGRRERREGEGEPVLTEKHSWARVGSRTSKRISGS